MVVSPQFALGQKAGRGFNLVDKNGRPVPNGVPSATSQIFDVTVAPGGARMFSPNSISIGVGDTVRWTWQGDFHSVTSGAPCTIDSKFCSPNDTDCPSGMLSSTGTVYMHTFDQAGDYSYFCASHCLGGMTGVVHVVGTPAFELMSAVSRKVHGAAGPFDVDLPFSGTPAVECRSGGGNYSFVFTFNNNVMSGNASVTSGTGSVSGAPAFSANTMTVNLTGVANVQTLTVTLSGVTDEFQQVLADTPVSAKFLIGDSSGNGGVNASDIVQTKGRIGQAVSAANFRSDVNVNGGINASDVSIVKTHSGESVP
jgi:plastocyanin